jgi:hypothetical protein
MMGSPARGYVNLGGGARAEQDSSSDDDGYDKIDDPGPNERWCVTRVLCCMRIITFST